MAELQRAARWVRKSRTHYSMNHHRHTKGYSKSEYP